MSEQKKPDAKKVVSFAAPKQLRDDIAECRQKTESRSEFIRQALREKIERDCEKNE